MAESTGTWAISLNYTLDGQKITTPECKGTFTFTGGKVQEIDVADDASQNDSWTEYLGVGISAAVMVLIHNMSGWEIDVDPNENGNAITIPPGGATFIVCPGSAGVIDNMNNYTYVLGLELTSASGSAGEVRAYICGVA